MIIDTPPGGILGKGGYGGLENISYLLARYLDEENHHVNLFATRDSYEPKNGHLFSVGKAGINPISAFKTYWNDERSKKALMESDICVDFSWSYFLYAPGIHNQLKKVCKSWHAPDPGYNPKNPPPYDHLNMICVSFDHAKRLSMMTGREVRAVQNGVDVNAYRYNPKPISERERLLWVSRIYVPKGAHRAIEIANSLKMPIDIVGGSFGDERENKTYVEQIKKMCEDSPYATLHGEVSFEKKAEFYHNAKAVLIPIEENVQAQDGKTMIWCLPENQFVNTVIPKEIKNVKKGDRIFSHNGSYNIVKNIFSKDYNGDITSIKVCNLSNPIKTSPQHKILALKPKKCVYNNKNFFYCTPLIKSCSCQKRKTSIKDNEEIEKKYYKAIELKKQGLSYIEISKKIGIPKTTTYYWTSKNVHPHKLVRPPYLDYKGEWISAGELTTNHFVGLPIPTEEKDIQKIDLSKEIKKYKLNNFDIKNNKIYHNNKRHMKVIDNTMLELTPEFLELCGYYVSEGYKNNYAMRLCFNENEKELIDNATNFSKKMFNIKSCSYRYRNNCCEVTISSLLFSSLFEKWFGKGSHNKQIPKWIFFLPKDKIISFIKGLWRGDGCISKRNTKEGIYESLIYVTVSRKLAYQLHTILLRLGIISFVRERIQGIKAKGVGNPIYNIIVSGDTIKLAKLINEDIQDYRKKNWRTKGFIKDNILWMPITKISKEKYIGKVFDIHVDESNSYTCQGIAVHNSEPFGLITIEANSCGTPTIVVPNGGWTESMIHGYNGFFANSNKEFEYFIKRIDEIKPENCLEMAKRFDYKVMGKNYLNLFEDIINGSGW